MNDFSKRVMYLMNTQNKTVRDIQHALGVTYEMARRYKLGTANPRPENLNKLADFFNVDPGWLQFGGEGEIPEISTALSTDLIAPFHDKQHRHRIDYLDVRAAAGLVGFENSDYPEVISSLFLTDEGMLQIVGKKNANGICIVNVPTDSMEPTIRKGDIVFIDTNINAYHGDGIYAFVLDGSLFIKRIQKLIGGGYRMISDNPIYPTEVISNEAYQSATFIGRFVRTVHIDAVNL